jgi:hypothetical protein
MRWLEAIRVRSLNLPEDQIASLAAGLQPEETFKGILLCVHVLRDISGSDDITIHLWWKGLGPAEKSREGLHVASWLRQHAPTEHAVWVEESISTTADGKLCGIHEQTETPY